MICQFFPGNRNVFSFYYCCFFFFLCFLGLLLFYDLIRHQYHVFFFISFLFFNLFIFTPIFSSATFIQLVGFQSLFLRVFYLIFVFSLSPLHLGVMWSSLLIGSGPQGVWRPLFISIYQAVRLERRLHQGCSPNPTEYGRHLVKPLIVPRILSYWHFPKFSCLIRIFLIRINQVIIILGLQALRQFSFFIRLFFAILKSRILGKVFLLIIGEKIT